MNRLTIEKCGELLIKNADSEYRSPCFGCESINKCNPEKMTCGYYKALEKLKEYEDLEEQGKLLKLPVAIGDTVYRVHKGTELSPTRVYECRVVAVKQEYNTVSIKLHANINEETYSIWVDNWFDKCQIGYEFFLTENEALQKMNEMEQ